MGKQHFCPISAQTLLPSGILLTFHPRASIATCWEVRQQCRACLQRLGILQGFTFEQRAAFPHHDGPGRSILAQAQLHEEERNPREKEHDEVRDEEDACGDHKHARMRKGGGVGERRPPHWPPHSRSSTSASRTDVQRSSRSGRHNPGGQTRQPCWQHDAMFCVTTSRARGWGGKNYTRLGVTFS